MTAGAAGGRSSAGERGDAGALDAREPGGATTAATFALLCVALGLLLPLGTEFVFIRDLFGSRMNSVFKLYFQAWTLLSVGAGYATWAVWRRLRSPWRLAWAVPTAALVAASLVYPIEAVYTRTNGFHATDATLDGLAWWRSSYPDDWAAAAWLREHADGTPFILEAYGGAYDHNGRISMATGLPTVLGWEGHEHQWRGTRDEIDPRKADIERMYKTRDEGELMELLGGYGVRYVIVSTAERAKFGLTSEDEARLRRVLRPVFESGSLYILERI